MRVGVGVIIGGGCDGGRCWFLLGIQLLRPRDGYSLSQGKDLLIRPVGLETYGRRGNIAEPIGWE